MQWKKFITILFSSTIGAAAIGIYFDGAVSFICGFVGFITALFAIRRINKNDDENHKEKDNNRGEITYTYRKTGIGPKITTRGKSTA